MKLIELVRELNSLNDDNLAARVVADSDVQWCLGELEDLLEVFDQVFNEEAVLKLAGQVLGMDADRLMALAQVEPAQWVSVDERLPHAEYGESDSVLVVTKLGSMHVLYFDGGNWCYPTGEPFIRTKSRVTHWMPLPEPPKEGKHE